MTVQAFRGLASPAEGGLRCAAACSGCGQSMARYYCGICNLWDDQPGRDIYHCPFCNLCRLGKGLGIDACHCMDCNTCMHLSEYPTHKCRDLAACPVCTDTLFDSSQPYRVRPAVCAPVQTRVACASCGGKPHWACEAGLRCRICRVSSSEALTADVVTAFTHILKHWTGVRVAINLLLVGAGFSRPCRL